MTNCLRKLSHSRTIPFGKVFKAPRLALSISESKVKSLDYIAAINAHGSNDTALQSQQFLHNMLHHTQYELS